jgi:hypothetical protein
MACMAKLKVMNSHCRMLAMSETRARATYNGVEASERSADGQTSETRLGDGAVNDPLLAEAVEEALGDLVSAQCQPHSNPMSCHHVATALCRAVHPPPAIARMQPNCRGVVTYAPLYCATSSPSTKTLSFCSISSAMASLSASRTVISFWPDAYPLLATIDGVRAAARKAGRNAGRDADESRREAGRRSREEAIVARRRVVESWGEWPQASDALVGVWIVDGCSTISSDSSGIHLLGQAQHNVRVRASATNPASHDVSQPLHLARLLLSVREISFGVRSCFTNN